MSVGKVIAHIGSVPRIMEYYKHKYETEAKEMTGQDIEKQVNNPNHKYAREVWNAALDKAAAECDKVLECKAAARIRELKK